MLIYNKRDRLRENRRINLRVEVAGIEVGCTSDCSDNNSDEGYEESCSSGVCTQAPDIGEAFTADQQEAQPESEKIDIFVRIINFFKSLFG